MPIYMKPFDDYARGARLSPELLCSPGDVRLAMPPRRMDANKFSSGSVMIVGGSQYYHGAPVLSARAASTAMAALRTGVGYVTVCVPKSIETAVRCLSAGLVVLAFDGDSLSKRAIGALEDVRHTVSVIGPGLGRGDGVEKAVVAFLKMEADAGRTVVVDGDAIRAMPLADSSAWANTIVTPHHGEFKAVTGVDLSGAKLPRRVEAAAMFAAERHCVIVLKGHETIVTDGMRVKINLSKSPALATMGTGDVLSGMIAAYASMSGLRFESAAAGVYVHSAIGDKLRKTKGLHIVAQDVIDAMPDFLRRFDRTVG
jgi:NAD(P)H-hydrate epimerase